MTPEKRFYNLLKSHLPGDYSRIESIADCGIPDINGVYAIQDYWIELKACRNKTLSIEQMRKLLLPSQRAWHAKRGNAGSLIFVIVKFNNNIIVFKKEQSILLYSIIYIDMKLHNKYNWEVFEESLKTTIINFMD